MGALGVEAAGMNHAVNGTTERTTVASTHRHPRVNIETSDSSPATTVSFTTHICSWIKVPIEAVTRNQ
jgi:hypothetical protein